MESATNKSLGSVAWFGLLLMGAFAALEAREQTVMAAEEKDITVTILLYSGRPDPTYVLDSEELINQVKARIAEAERASGPTDESVIPSILGYKGIRVQSPRGKPDFPSRIAIYKGKMEVVDGQRQILVDTGGELEKILLNEAIRRELIEDKILERMKKER